MSRKQIDRKPVAFAVMLCVLLATAMPLGAQDTPDNPRHTEMLQTIMRTAPAGIGMVENRVIVMINDYIVDLIGYREDELLGQSARMLYPTQEDSDYVGEEKYRQIAEKGTGTVETRWLRKDGSIRHIILSSTPLDVHDLARGVIFTVQDISALKLAQEEQTALQQNLIRRTGLFLAGAALFCLVLVVLLIRLARGLKWQKATAGELRESKQRFQSLVENIDDWIWEVDANGLYTYVSPTVTNMLGYLPEEMLGKTAFDFMPPDEAQRIASVFGALVAEHKPMDRLENTNIHKDGRLLLLECSGLPYFSDQGTFLGYRGTVRDITERKRVEEALRESEARFKSIIAVSNTGAWEYHGDKDYLWCSPEYFTMLGYDPGEFTMDGSANLAQTWIDLIHPDDRDRASAHFAKYLADGSVGMYENFFRMKRCNGNWVWIWSRGQTLRDGEGKVTQITVGTHIDITERKQYEEKILFSERTYKEIFNNSTDALFIHDIDTGAIVDVNNTMLEMYGYERHEIAELGVADLSASMEPYSNERAGQLIKKAASGETVVFEWLNRKKNGALFYSENVLRFVNIAGVDRIMAVVRDITERKQAEDALRESEAKLSALFTSMTEMVVMHEVVFDEAGKPVNYRITDCNAAFSRITGISREEAVGKLATEVYGTPEPPYLEEFSSVGITGEPYHYETYFPPMDKHFAISVVSPGKNRFATITADISEAKRIQAVIDGKNKELEQLVYIASHDLRSPLVNVDGFSREIDYSIKDLSSLLDDGTDTEALVKALRKEFPDMEKSIARIRASAAQMDKLLKGLLHLSRLGRAALLIDDIDMNDCLAQIANSFAFVMKEKGGELRVDTLPACRGDAGQLTRVFSNLIDNAIKYRDPDRPLKVRVSGSMEAGRAVYRVTDNGVGIADNHLEHVFELFHRLEPGKTEGEGLGLTVARQTVSRLYGEIQVESEVGRGSVFIVSLPPVRHRANGK